jgi:hypothetical protein
MELACSKDADATKQATPAKPLESNVKSTDVNAKAEPTTPAKPTHLRNLQDDWRPLFAEKAGPKGGRGGASLNPGFSDLQPPPDNERDATFRMKRRGQYYASLHEELGKWRQGTSFVDPDMVKQQSVSEAQKFREMAEATLARTELQEQKKLLDKVPASLKHEANMKLDLASQASARAAEAIKRACDLREEAEGAVSDLLWKAQEDEVRIEFQRRIQGEAAEARIREFASVGGAFLEDAEKEEEQFADGIQAFKEFQAFNHGVVKELESEGELDASSAGTNDALGGSVGGDVELASDFTGSSFDSEESMDVLFEAITTGEEGAPVEASEETNDVTEEEGSGIEAEQDTMEVAASTDREPRHFVTRSVLDAFELKQSIIEAEDAEPEVVANSGEANAEMEAGDEGEVPKSVLAAFELKHSTIEAEDAESEVAANSGEAHTEWEAGDEGEVLKSVIAENQMLKSVLAAFELKQSTIEAEDAESEVVANSGEAHMEMEAGDEGEVVIQKSVLKPFELKQSTIKAEDAESEVVANSGEAHTEMEAGDEGEVDPESAIVAAGYLLYSTCAAIKDALQEENAEEGQVDVDEPMEIAMDAEEIGAAEELEEREEEEELYESVINAEYKTFQKFVTGAERHVGGDEAVSAGTAGGDGGFDSGIEAFREMLENALLVPDDPKTSRFEEMRKAVRMKEGHALKGRMQAS